MNMGGASGRVRLADFHGSPKFPHYQFTEKEEYLQQVTGTLGLGDPILEKINMSYSKMPALK